MEGSERLLKRPRTHLSQSRDTTISLNSTPVLDTGGVELSDDLTTVIESASQVVRRRNAPRRLVSLPLRSGRSRNLPVRYRS
jgi:urease accessory protein UreE